MTTIWSITSLPPSKTLCCYPFGKFNCLPINRDASIFFQYLIQNLIMNCQSCMLVINSIRFHLNHHHKYLFHHLYQQHLQYFYKVHNFTSHSIFLRQTYPFDTYTTEVLILGNTDVIIPFTFTRFWIVVPIPRFTVPFVVPTIPESRYLHHQNLLITDLK